MSFMIMAPPNSESRSFVCYEYWFSVRQQDTSINTRRCSRSCLELFRSGLDHSDPSLLGGVMLINAVVGVVLSGQRHSLSRGGGARWFPCPGVTRFRTCLRARKRKQLPYL